jgi:putative membrane protein
MFYQHNMDTGGWIFMVLGNIVIWGLIITFIIWLAQDVRTRPHRHHTASGASAREILDRRLASGEISVEEYQRLRATLGQPAGEQPTGTGSPAGAPT